LSDIRIIVFGCKSSKKLFILPLENGIVRIRCPYVYTTGSSGKSFSTGLFYIIGTGIFMFVTTITHKGKGELQVSFFSSFHQHTKTLGRFGLYTFIPYIFAFFRIKVTPKTTNVERITIVRYLHSTF
jgi:hypothetical protein